MYTNIVQGETTTFRLVKRTHDALGRRILPQKEIEVSRGGVKLRLSEGDLEAAFDLLKRVHGEYS